MCFWAFVRSRGLPEVSRMSDYQTREPPQLDIPREQLILLNEIIQEHIRALGFGYSELAGRLA
jgi:hypothetical protein